MRICTLDLTIPQVLAAQTRLAQELHRRPVLYEMYLTELLTLFCDKGVAIQNAAITSSGAKVLRSIVQCTRIDDPLTLHRLRP
jgi:hypothetical protein